MAREPITSEDLQRSGELAREALARLTEAQWSEQPPNMTWTRFITASHICGALQFYATQLATGSPKYVATIPQDEAQMKPANMPDHVMAQSNLLSRVAEAAPPGTRGYHGAGSPDAEGYLAMGCAEVLLHAWDCMNGAGDEFVADDGIARRVVQRLFPWAPTGIPGWQTLLFETGRGELDGHESPGEYWMWHNAPLDEWDGKVRRSDVWVDRK